MNYQPEHTWGHTIAFGEEYYQNSVKMLRAIRDDAAVIGEFAARCAAALRAGHKVYANAAAGHMPRLELDNEREGNPAMFEFSPTLFTPEQHAAMQEGDVLFINRVTAAARQVRDAGVYVVAFTTCYANNRNAPLGMIRPGENDYMPEDVASHVVESHIPWEQGLVHAPEVPEMALFPGSAIGTSTTHWMITAEVAHALETGTASDGGIGRQYVDILLERLQAVHSQDTGRIDQEAVTIARRIIAGGHLFVRSRNGGVQSEATGVAQGLMLVNAFEPRPAAEGGDQDIFLIAAVSADDPQELEWADEARANGNYIVGIGPSDNDGLRRRCDVYFDDRCEEKAGVIAIPGHDEKVCPATGILNLIIMHMLAAQFVDEMCRRGAVPYFYMGNYRVLGRDYNNVMKPIFQVRGY
jgi:uncharacterized phosphosugar-binding protein